MSDTRTYIVPDGQENSTNQMLPWMAMMNGGMGGFGNGMWNNPLKISTFYLEFSGCVYIFIYNLKFKIYGRNLENGRSD